MVNEESAMEIEISKIHPFKNHPFKVLDDEKIFDLILETDAACTGIKTESEETSALIVIIPRLGIQSIRIKSYRHLIASIYSFMIISLLITFPIVTSNAESSIFAGRRSTFSW